MYCPQCRVEYREGFTNCSDCGVALMPGAPPPPDPAEEPSPTDPALDLVEVLRADDALQLAMAKGLLEDSNVPFVLVGRITTLMTDVDPFLHKPVRIHVPRNREAEARELLEPLLHPDPGMPAAVDEASAEAGESS